MVKYLWMFSMLGYLAVLLLTYVYLPLGVNVFSEADGAVLLKLGQEQYFWAGLTLVLFVNGLIQMLGNMVLFLPAPLLPFPKSKFWMSQEQHRRTLKQNFKRWLKGLALIINLFLAASLVYLYTLNDSDVSLNLDLAFYLIGALFLGWIVFFFVWFNDTESKLAV